MDEMEISEGIPVVCIKNSMALPEERGDPDGKKMRIWNLWSSYENLETIGWWYSMICMIEIEIVALELLELSFWDDHDDWNLMDRHKLFPDNFRMSG